MSDFDSDDDVDNMQEEIQPPSGGEGAPHGEASSSSTIPRPRSPETAESPEVRAAITAMRKIAERLSGHLPEGDGGPLDKVAAWDVPSAKIVMRTLGDMQSLKVHSRPEPRPGDEIKDEGVARERDVDVTSEYTLETDSDHRDGQITVQHGTEAAHDVFTEEDRAFLEAVDRELTEDLERHGAAEPDMS